MKRNVDLYVAVDGGMSDNLRPMLYGARYEAQVASRFGGGTLLPPGGQALRVGRPASSATPSWPTRGWATSSSPRPPAPTASPWSNNYNGVPRAPVVIVSGGDARVVVRRETYDDLLARDVEHV